jgi:hypothetical protein
MHDPLLIKKKRKKERYMHDNSLCVDYLSKKKKNSPINFIFGMHDRHELDGW